MANGMIILITLLKKTYNRLNIMRASSTFSLEKNYISFIEPLMEYADVIWYNQKQNLINKLENIQLDAARIVTGGIRLTSHDSLYEETKWEKLKDRRNSHKLVLFHKMNYYKTPQYLAELIPKTASTRHNTSQINNIVNINCPTSLYPKYFLPSTVKAWNDLPLPTRNLESLNSFKSLINTKTLKFQPIIMLDVS
jgi:hypothetical protein